MSRNPLRAMILVQRFARHVLHRDKLNPIGIRDVVDMNDIRVIEGGRGFGPAQSGAYDPRRRSSLPAEPDCDESSG
ncbi:MAG: hypothetical protein ACJ74Z_10460 [Bryobacteraceae bacterium]